MQLNLPIIERRMQSFISPLMSLYWFFDANVVAAHNLFVPELRATQTKDEAYQRVIAFVNRPGLRPRARRVIPY